MANEFLNKVGTQISFADHAGDFSPAAANSLEQGTPTTVQLSLISLGSNAYRQSAKFDFGATRARQYSMIAAIEMDIAPTAGDVIKFYLAFSPDSTAANGNPGGASGSDAAYAGYSSNASDSIKQLVLVGIMPVTVQIATIVQISICGVFSASERFASLVVHNDTDQAFEGDDIEMHIVLNPIIDELQ